MINIKKNISNIQRDFSYPSLSNVQQRINDLFEGSFFDIETFPSFCAFNRFPSFNIQETDREIIIEAELPSIDEKDLILEVNKNQMLLKCEKKKKHQEKEGMYYLREISYGKFSRMISLQFDIDINKTKASFLNGVLTITVQKPEEQVQKVKTIPIQTT